MNKAIIIGRLGATPEVKFLPSGTSVTEFTLATSEKWKDDKGEEQTRTEWHKIKAFGKPGETIAKYLVKGDPLMVEGKIQTRSWEDKGQKKYMTEIMMEKFEFLGSKKQ